MIYGEPLLFHLVKLCNSAAAQSVVKLEGVKCCDGFVLKITVLMHLGCFELQKHSQNIQHFCLPKLMLK